ncbi:WD40 repeat domain-containing protein [Acidobacteria bacterium AH-259-D05]|nr:WD40 repeat domain-containing protein [Acidobacteria bacterium AH-259-D05]
MFRVVALSAVSALLMSVSGIAPQSEFASRVTTLDLEYPIRSVEFSPDGHLFIAATAFVVKIWETETWKEVKLRTVEYPDYLISRAQFTPDGKQFAIAYNGSRSGIKLINVSSGQQVDIPPLLKEQEEFVDVLTFHPAGQWMVYGGDKGFLKSWDLVRAPREPLGMIRADPKRVWSAAFSHTGGWLATAGSETVQMWSIDGETGIISDTPRWTLERGATQVVFDERDERLFVKYTDHSIGMINTDLGEASTHYVPMDDLDYEKANYLHYWLPKHALLTTGTDGMVRIWGEGKPIAEQNILGSRESHLDLRASAISPNGTLLASGYENGEITISQLSPDGP